MAAFSHHPFLVDSVFFPNTNKFPEFSEQPNTLTPCFPQFYPYEPPHETPIDYNEPCVTNMHSAERSSVVDKIEMSEQVTQIKITPMKKKRKNRDGSSSTSAQSKDPKEVREKKKKRSNGEVKKGEAEKEEKKVPEGEGGEAPKGYIHVRARRGEATDSHSLAERVRREKISVRMKMLQALVPGCDKVTGKALMLDEIINYVWSLQNQIEFLSMKLSSLNHLFNDFGVDLDAFMVTHERLSDLASPVVPNVQQSSATQHTAFSDATTTTNYTLLDTSPSILLQQEGQSPHVISQACLQLLKGNVIRTPLFPPTLLFSMENITLLFHLLFFNVGFGIKNEGQVNIFLIKDELKEMGECQHYPYSISLVQGNLAGNLFPL